MEKTLESAFYLIKNITTKIDTDIQNALNKLELEKAPKDSATLTGSTLVERNVADANPAFTTNLKNASSTGNIHEYKFADVLVGYVDRFGTPAGGTEQTIANANKYFPLLKDIYGNVVIRKFTNVWNGSAYVTDQSYAFGYTALGYNTGIKSNGFGYSALQNNIGDGSNGFGYLALYDNSGDYSNGFGFASLQYNKSNYSNGFGHATLQNNIGDYSNGVGHATLLNNVGLGSNGMGYSALYNNTGTGANGFGYLALRYNQKNGNTVMGDNAYGSAFLDNTAGNKTVASSAVDISLDRVTVTAHGFGATNAYINIKYASTTGTKIGGLTVGIIYQIKIIDANTIEFRTDGRGVTLASQGVGNHVFTPQFAYANVSCFGQGTIPNKDNQVVLGNPTVDTIKMGGTNRTPASATDTGVKGEVCFDASYMYVCVATNTWKRTALATW